MSKAKGKGKGKAGGDELKAEEEKEMYAAKVWTMQSKLGIFWIMQLLSRKELRWQKNQNTNLDRKL